MAHEYTVIPAPRRAEKTKGAKTTADRFAHTLAEAINAMARQGWDYVRAEVLPCEERSGLTGRKITDQHVLVFRRAINPVPAPLPEAEEVSAPMPPLRPAEPSPAPRPRPAVGGLSALAGLGTRPAGRAEAPPLRAPSSGRADPDSDSEA